jgi:pimeloyl-ACP methyl ester carboxylesterase
MAGKPTFVLVPGAWHGPETWDKVSSLLKQQGYTAIAITLPTTTGSTSLTIVDDVKATQDVIRAETSQCHNVIVVVHSYGGLVGQSAMKGFTRPKDTPTSPTQGYVIGNIVIASGFTQAGKAFLDGTGGNPPPSWRLDPSGFAELQVDARELFYHDLPVAEGDAWVTKLRPQSSKAFTEGRDVTYAGWQDVPSWALLTTEDKAFPVDFQRMFVGMVKGTVDGSAMGILPSEADITVKEIDSSHSPMLSRPKEVVDFILDATAAFSK